MLGEIKKGRKPKAIITVHGYEVPCKMDRIVQIAAAHDIPLVEDATEAVGSRYKGRPYVYLGDYGIFFL